MPPSGCRPKASDRVSTRQGHAASPSAVQHRERPPRKPRLQVYIKKLLNHCCFTAPKQLEFWHDPNNTKGGQGRREAAARSGNKVQSFNRGTYRGGDPYERPPGGACRRVAVIE